LPDLYKSLMVMYHKTFCY